MTATISTLHPRPDRVPEYLWDRWTRAEQDACVHPREHEQALDAVLDYIGATCIDPPTHSGFLRAALHDDGPGMDRQREGAQ